MTLKFNRIDDTFIRVDYEIEHNGRKAYPCFATIQKTSYGRKLWQVDIEGKGRLSDYQGNDCFSLVLAKGLVKQKYKTLMRKENIL